MQYGTFEVHAEERRLDVSMDRASDLRTIPGAPFRSRYPGLGGVRADPPGKVETPGYNICTSFVAGWY